jgi:hypothetical protein
MKDQPIYISGKITGLPEDEVYEKFAKAENRLLSEGFTKIVNPVTIEHSHNKTWESYMLKDIEVLFQCASVYMIYDWEDSKGARIEHAIAKTLGKNIIYQNWCSDPVHTWFELSYAQYLTVPRSVLQSMPLEWQIRFVQCLEELDETIDWRPKSGRYWVKLKDDHGRYVEDEFMDYQRGRRQIPHIQKL